MIFLLCTQNTLYSVFFSSSRLNDCGLTDESCLNLAKALGSDNNLIELNMSNNNLRDSGGKQLCIGLENIMCKIEILR